MPDEKCEFEAKLDYDHMTASSSHAEGHVELSPCSEEEIIRRDDEISDVFSGKYVSFVPEEINGDRTHWDVDDSDIPEHVCFVTKYIIKYARLFPDETRFDMTGSME